MNDRLCGENRMTFKKSIHAYTYVFAADRLQNLEIRVGNDGQDIENKAVCFKQLEAWRCNEFYMFIRNFW